MELFLIVALWPPVSGLHRDHHSALIMAEVYSRPPTVAVPLSLCTLFPTIRSRTTPHTGAIYGIVPRFNVWIFFELEKKLFTEIFDR